MTTIAITGSSGLIGTALREAIEASGDHAIRVLRGNQSDPAALWNPATGWFRPGALEGVDAVVHLAGESVGEGRWSEKRKAELTSSRIDATRILVDHLASLVKRPAVLVSASGAGFYGDRGEETMTEDSAAGGGFLAGLVVAWEKEVQRAAELGIRVVTLRFGVILDKRGGALTRLLLPFKLGAGGRIGNGRQYMPLVSLGDAVGAIRHAISTPTLSGPVNVSVPEPATNNDFTKALGKALHRPTLLPVPTFALNAMLGRETAREMLFFSARVLPTKLQDSGYQFRAPSVDATIAEALA